MRVVALNRCLRTGLALTGALALGGCNPLPRDCPLDCQISLKPDNVVVGKSFVFWELDNIGAAFFVDALVQDGDGLPLQNMKVYVQAPSTGVGLVPANSVKVVSPAALPDDWANIKNDVCLDENGALVLTNELCGYYYDETSDRYYDLGSGVVDGFADTASPPGQYMPDYLEGVTDRSGVLRTWVFIDQLPVTVGADDVEQGGVNILYSVRVDAIPLTIETSN